MRRTSPFRAESGRLDVKMTPMIDVVFLLLIFFVCTASFQRLEELLPTQLRAAGSTTVEIEVPPELEELDDIVIKIVSTAGRLSWRINDRPYERFDELRERLGLLAAFDTSLPVILDVNGDVPVGAMIDVLDVCRLAGFDHIGFATSEPS